MRLPCLLLEVSAGRIAGQLGGKEIAPGRVLPSAHELAWPRRGGGGTEEDPQGKKLP